MAASFPEETQEKRQRKCVVEAGTSDEVGGMRQKEHGEMKIKSMETKE